MTRKPLTPMHGTKASAAQVDAANRIIPRFHALKAAGMDSYDAMLRARVEDAAAQWLATLPFGKVVDPEPGHVILSAYYYGADVAEDMRASYRIAQRWAPVFGMDNFNEWGLLFAQCVSRKYYGQSPSRR